MSLQCLSFHIKLQYKLRTYSYQLYWFHRNWTLNICPILWLTCLRVSFCSVLLGSVFFPCQFKMVKLEVFCMAAGDQREEEHRHSSALWQQLHVKERRRGEEWRWLRTVGTRPFIWHSVDQTRATSVAFLDLSAQQRTLTVHLKYSHPSFIWTAVRYTRINWQWNISHTCEGYFVILSVQFAAWIQQHICLLPPLQICKFLLCYKTYLILFLCHCSIWSD